MTDVISKRKRSEVMSKVKSENTKIEKELKNLLRGLNFRYQPSNIYGKPDFAIKKRKIAVFLDSCFWHKCPLHFRAPSSNKAYWRPKINRNARRAKEVNKKLNADGWLVIRFWEHQVRENPEKIEGLVVKATKNHR